MTDDGWRPGTPGFPERRETMSERKTFDAWFGGRFLDPDGGSAHLPDWLKEDLRSAWDAGRGSPAATPPNGEPLYRRFITADRIWYEPVAPQTDLREALQQLVDYVIDGCPDGSYIAVIEAKAALSNIRALPHAARPPNPVAYRWRQPGNKHWIYDPTPEWIEDHKHEIELEPLYVAPARELFDRSAVEATCKRYIESALTWQPVFEDGRGGNDLTFGDTRDLICKRLADAICTVTRADCKPDDIVYSVGGDGTFDENDDPAVTSQDYRSQGE